ncbi:MULTISPECIES: YqzE family protein [Bacillaceae]|uniref:YqzE family protein n=1 Tax=Evansella alkalicola TaxID=745819 RepID=A0ABS6K015_9BACI|nr:MULTISPECIES: YqzE family protein [Bacillaceae]MBU9724190.1 YqzE family protein [Bacillus alkalicola]
MKTNDYVKFMTQQFVTYAQQPKEERRAKREEKKAYRAPRSYRLFGLIPFAVSQTFRQFKK